MAENPFSPVRSTVNDNPFLPASGPSGSAGGLGTLAAMASVQPQIPEQPTANTPTVLYSPSQNKMFVNGALFDADDASSALETVGNITQPRVDAPAGYDWSEVSPQQYDDYIRNINNPGWGQLMARNFEIGGSNLKLLAGRGAQFLGAEETGQEWVNSALQELYYNEPYQREFTNIEFGSSESHGAIDWFVANLAQQGPNLIESVVTILAGGLAGAAAGGGANPFTATGGAILGFMGKQTFKQSVLAAAKKYMRGEVLTNGERKLLREVAGLTGYAQLRNPRAFIVNPAGQARLMRNNAAIRSQIDDAILTGANTASRVGRNQAIAGGAFFGGAAGSYGMGVADIYGEVRDTGVGDRLTAALGAFPYAAMEMLPEFVLAGRIFGGTNLLSRSSLTRGNRLQRGAKGFGVGAILEGATEAGQESLLLAATDQEFNNPEAIKRLINSFAAGAAIGGTLGTVSNALKSGEPTNVLNSEANAEPTQSNTPVDPSNPNPSPLEGGPVGQLPAPPSVAALPPPSGTQGELFSAAEMGQPTQVPAAPTTTTPQQVSATPAPTVVNEQQGGTNNTIEQALNNQTMVASPEGQVVPTPNQVLEDQRTGQMQLPLEDPTIQAAKITAQQQPETQQTAMGQQMLQAALAREEQQKRETQQAVQAAAIARQEAEAAKLSAERQRQFDEATQQRQAQQIRELENARVEQILAENERLQRENLELKAPPAPPREPVQDSLPGFGVPYGVRRLQRGQQAAQQVPQAAPVQRPDTRQLELPLFADEAELDGMNIVRLKGIARSLGVTGYSNVKKPVLLDKIKTKLREDQANAIQERSPAQVDVREQPQAGTEVRVGDTQEQQTTAAPRGAERLRTQAVSETGSSEAQADTTVGEDQTQGTVQQPTDSTQQERQPNRQEDTSVTTTSYEDVVDAWDSSNVSTLPFDRMPQRIQDAFTDLVNKGQPVPYDEAKRLADEGRNALDALEPSDGGITVQETLDEAISFMDSASDITTIEYAADVIVEFAFFNTDSSVTKKLADGTSPQSRALAYINTTEFDAKQRATINTAFINQANMADQLTGSVRGKDRPWVMYAAQANLLDAIQAPMRSMPSWYNAEQEVVTGETVAAAEQEAVTEEVVQTPDEQRQYISQELEGIISSHIAGWPTNPITDQNKSEKANGTLTEKGRLENMFANANPDFRTSRGPKLKDFFNEDGTLKLRKASGTDQVGYVPTTKVLTKEQQEQATREAKEARKAARLKEQERLRDIRQMMGEDDRGSIFDSFDDGLDGMYLRAGTGQKIDNPLPKGKIKLIVNKVLKGLRAKPTVTIVDNFEDLRVNYPELYARAAKGRPDFGQVNALGYSIADQIIIFADFIMDESAVRHVIGHEALGHFGFRAFMPRDRLNAIFREIYKSDSEVRASADTKIDAGMSLEEAVEESMADMAADLDVSTVKRFFNRIKDFLSLFGAFSDGNLTRYLLRQSRRNLRTGGFGLFSGRKLAHNLQEMAKEQQYGRYSIGSTLKQADVAEVFFTHFGMNKVRNNYNGFTGLKQVFQRASEKPSDFANIGGELLERLQSLSNMASKSEGLLDVFGVFQDQQAMVRRLQAEFAEMTKFSHTPNWFKNGAGPTDAELQLAGEMLAYAAMYKGNMTTEQMIRDSGKLVYTDAEGNAVIDPRAFAQLKAAGRVTQEQFDAGLPYTLDVGGQGTYTPNYANVDREKVWRIYTEQRDAVDQAALEVLKANVEAATIQKNEAIANFLRMAGRSGVLPASSESQTFRRIIEEYTKLYKENAVQEGSGYRYNEDSVKRANDFIEEINKALHNPLKVNDWKTANPNEKASQFQGERYQDIIDGLERLNGLGLSQRQAYTVTNAIRNIYLLDVKNSNAEFLAKRTIMGAYVPFTRRGKFQVMLKAVGPNGKAVDLSDDFRNSMPYFQVNSREEAREVAAELEASFNNNTYEVTDSDSNPVNVQFVAEYSVARQSQPITHSVNLNEFTDVLSRLNISVTPQERERIVVALTRQGERARRSLQRSGVAGWDQDVVRSVAEHLETASHMAGKAKFRHKLNGIMIDNNKWRGDPQKLEDLHNEMLEAERSGNFQRIQIARKNYDSYAAMYKYSADVGTSKTFKVYKNPKIGTNTRESVDIKPLGRGEIYREEAKRLVAWYGDAANIDQSTEDMLSGEAGSKFKMLVVLGQLGGSVATAAVNSTSIVTHAGPYLATYNAKRGYGGGFGLGKAYAELRRAFANVKNYRLADFDYVNDVADNQLLQRKHNLTSLEAEALREATAEGVLQAAQGNALLGTARGGVKSNKGQSAIRAWMWMFSYTEQLNRRTTFLAAYRLEYQKQLAANVSKEDAHNRAQKFAKDAVNNSQGEYAMYNRPEMARGNVLQYLFMYKQFVVITVEMFKQLAPKEKMVFLAVLLATSGLKGVPFSDDFMDLIDTLLQKMPGVTHASIEKELIELFDSIVPGSSKFVMRGLLDGTLGVTVSTRMGHGDLIPLTGAFKSGSDVGREITNFIGPMWSASEQTVVTLGRMLRYGSEVVGLSPDTTQLSDVFRKAPLTAVRSIADGLTYLTDGRIINDKGSVIDNDVGIGVAIGRMLGFYPASATFQNDLVRLGRQTSSYMQDVTAHYIQAYVKARLDRDVPWRRSIERAVRDHNREWRGTEFEIKNFEQRAYRSYNMNKNPLFQRYLQTTPLSQRDQISDLADMYGIELN